MVSSANQPAAVMYPEMPMQIRGATLTRIRAAPNDDRPADTALCAQRIVSAQVEVRPNSAGIRHGAQTARVGAYPVRDATVPAGRRGRGRRRRGRRGRWWWWWEQGRWRRRRRRHTRLVEVAVLFVLRFLFHRETLSNVVRRSRRDRFFLRKLVNMDLLALWNERRLELNCIIRFFLII